MAGTQETPTTTTEEEKNTVTEFYPGQPHPDTPKSVLREQNLQVETRAYQADDDRAAEETWAHVRHRKTKRYIAEIQDPVDPEKTNTYIYEIIKPGDSLLLNDLAILTGLIYYNEHIDDTPEKAHAEGRLEEYVKTRQKMEADQFHYENKVFSLGLRKTIEDVKETLKDPEERKILLYLIQGGAVPRNKQTPQSDVDTFPKETPKQKPRKGASKN